MILAADAALDPVSALVVNGGIIGVFFALALLGQIALRPEIVRRDDQEKRQQALIDTLLAVYHHEVLPTLGDYEKRLAPVLRQVEDRLKELDYYRGKERDVGPETRYPTRRRHQDDAGGGGSHGPGPDDYPPAPQRP